MSDKVQAAIDKREKARKPTTAKKIEKKEA